MDKHFIKLESTQKRWKLQFFCQFEFKSNLSQKRKNLETPYRIFRSLTINHSLEFQMFLDPICLLGIKLSFFIISPHQARALYNCKAAQYFIKSSSSWLSREAKGREIVTSSFSSIKHFFTFHFALERWSDVLCAS